MPTVPLYPADFRTTPPRKFKRSNKRLVSMPDRGVSPHVKLVFSEMAKLGARYDDVEFGSGVRRPTVKQWRRKVTLR